MWVLYSVFMYIVIGALLCIPFLSRFIDKVDEGAIGSPWTFRLAILPGCVVFWPVLLIKFLKIRNS